MIPESATVCGNHFVYRFEFIALYKMKILIVLSIYPYTLRVSAVGPSTSWFACLFITL